MEMKFLVNIWILFGSFEFIIFVECFTIFYHKSITILKRRGDLKKKLKMLAKENIVNEFGYYNETSIMGAIRLMKHNFEINVGELWLQS